MPFSENKYTFLMNINHVTLVHLQFIRNIYSNLHNSSKKLPKNAYSFNQKYLQNKLNTHIEKYTFKMG